MAYSDRELLARIIQCEAGGEGDNGMKAVATVTMNRVNVPMVSMQDTLCFYRPTSKYAQT